MVLAVLSDSESTSELLHARLVRLGLGGRFTAVVSSFDLERTKPDPVCYHEALSAIGMRAEQVAFVGHDADEMAGAKAVGLRTLAFNFEPGTKADRYLARFEELLDYTSRRGARYRVPGGRVRCGFSRAGIAKPSDRHQRARLDFGRSLAHKVGDGPKLVIRRGDQRAARLGRPRRGKIRRDDWEIFRHRAG